LAGAVVWSRLDHPGQSVPNTASHTVKHNPKSNPTVVNPAGSGATINGVSVGPQGQGSGIQGADASGMGVPASGSQNGDQGGNSGTANPRVPTASGALATVNTGKGRKGNQVSGQGTIRHSPSTTGAGKHTPRQPDAVIPQPVKEPVELPQTGFVLIKSAPPFAALTINGKPQGETPMNAYLEVPVGNCHVEIVHRLSPPFDTVIKVTPGYRREFKFKLDR
ncbi:MAG: hypothetical protein ABI036_05545, partial [Fibrobacteria bacterium]